MTCARGGGPQRRRGGSEHATSLTDHQTPQASGPTLAHDTRKRRAVIRRAFTRDGRDGAVRPEKGGDVGAGACGKLPRMSDKAVSPPVQAVPRAPQRGRGGLRRRHGHDALLPGRLREPLLRRAQPLQPRPRPLDPRGVRRRRRRGDRDEHLRRPPLQARAPRARRPRAKDQPGGRPDRARGGGRCRPSWPARSAPWASPWRPWVTSRGTRPSRPFGSRPRAFSRGAWTSFLVETMPSLDQATAALEAVRSPDAPTSRSWSA